VDTFNNAQIFEGGKSGEKSIVFVMTILTGKEISKPMKFRE
jgi:hypothetical protein